MTIMSRLSILLACCLLLFSSPADAADAGDHNSTRSNSGTVAGSKEKPNGQVSLYDSRSISGTVAGGGNASDTDLYVGNDKVVRKKPGRTTYSTVTLTYGTGVEQLVEDDEAFVSIVEQFLVQSASESEAIEYGLIAALMSDSDAEAIEYGLIAALMSDSDAEAIEYGLIAALLGDSDAEAIEYGLIAALLDAIAEDQPVELDDKIVRKKPNRVGDGVDLDSTEMVNPARADSTATSGRNGPGDLFWSFTISANYVRIN